MFVLVYVHSVVRSCECKVVVLAGKVKTQTALTQTFESHHRNVLVRIVRFLLVDSNFAVGTC